MSHLIEIKKDIISKNKAIEMKYLLAKLNDRLDLTQERINKFRTISIKMKRKKWSKINIFLEKCGMPLGTLTWA